MTPLRPTTVVQVETVVGGIVHITVGLIFIAAGLWTSYYAIQHPPMNKTLLYAGIGSAVFGALVMPTMLSTVKQIIVVGQGLPLVGNFLGGRRSTDAPARTLDEPPPDPKG